jgi:hypothetical protein
MSASNYLLEGTMLSLLLLTLSAGQDPSTSPDNSKTVSLEDKQIVVRNTRGHLSFTRAIPVPAPCESPSLSWLDPRILLIMCHVNPSTDVYQEVDISTGKTLLSGLGFGFERSPDGRRLAFAGWVPHFSPPYQTSNYLQIDGTAVYPKPASKNEELNLARRVGDRYVGIHDFQQPWVWSPDSRFVALVDREFDWQLDTSDQGGKEVNEHFYLVVAGRQAPLRVEIPASDTLHWRDNQTLEIGRAGANQTFRLTDLKP